MYNNEKAYPPEHYKNIDCRLQDVTETVLIKTLLFGSCSVDAHTNTQILNASSEYILTTKRFEASVSFLIRKSFWLFFPLYNDKNIPILIENKTVSSMGSFVASSFAYYY